MSNDKPKNENPPETVSRADYEALLARLTKVENPEELGNPIIARTCNSCGKPVNDKGVCPTHPTEHVNHIAMGLDVETGLKRPVIKSQTRA